MRIVIRYSGQARTVVGSASESLELEKPLSVRELLIHLSGKYSGLGPLVLTAQGEPQPSLLLFVGENQVEPGSELLLQLDDVLSIMPPMAGG